MSYHHWQVNLFMKYKATLYKTLQKKQGNTSKNHAVSNKPEIAGVSDARNDFSFIPLLPGQRPISKKGTGGKDVSCSFHPIPCPLGESRDRTQPIHSVAFSKCEGGGYAKYAAFEGKACSCRSSTHSQLKRKQATKKSHRLSHECRPHFSWITPYLIST